jgi:hypothetical protein
VAQDEDRGGYLTSQLRFNAREGVEYQIAIDGFAGQQGNFILGWELETTSEELPVIMRDPAGGVAIPEDDVIFSVVAEGTNLHYQWFFNDQSIPNATNSSLRVASVALEHVGLYVVHVTNQFLRSAESLPAALELAGSAHPLTQDKWEDLLPLFAGGGGAAPAAGLKSPAGLESSSGSLTPILVSVGTIDYHIFNTRNSQGSITDPTPCDVIGGASTWQAFRPTTNGVLVLDTIGSDFDTVLVLYTLTNDDLTTLREVACNNNGAPDGRRSYLRVNVQRGQNYLAVVDGVNGTKGTAVLNWKMGLPPTVLGGAISTNTIPEGRAVLLEAPPVSSLFPYHFQWRLNGSDIVGATNQTFLLEDLEGYHSGSYSVVVANWFGAVIHAVAQLTVEVPYLKAESVQSNRVYRVWLPEFTDKLLLLEGSTDLIHWTTFEQLRAGFNPLSYRDYPMIETSRLFIRVIPAP